MTNLPDSWTETGFTELFDVQGGTQPPKSTFVYELTQGYVQLLQIRDFGERPVPTFIPDTRGLKKCDRNDILIARYGASLGRILTGMTGAYNVAMAKVIVPEELNRKFVFYLLKSEAFQAPLRLVSRSAQNGFNKDDLALFEVPLAPLNEQRRIADKLDATLARIDACRARLDRVAAILKRFRQAVLAAAVSGKLTEEWRGDNAIYIDNNHSLPSSWKVKKSVEVCESVRDGTHDTPKYVSEGIPLVTSKNISPSGIDFESANLISVKDHYEISKRSGVSKGDILISMIGTVGQICIVDTDIQFSIKNVGLFKTNPSLCTPKYLFYWLQSPQFSSWLMENMRGGNQKFVSLGLLRNCPVYFPPIQEQAEIVRRVETLFAFASRLETSLATGNKRLADLTPALLAKAFRGELVPQDPSDEPADALLERIRAARESAGERGGKRGRKPRETAATEKPAARPTAEAGNGAAGKRGRGRPRKETPFDGTLGL